MENCEPRVYAHTAGLLERDNSNICSFGAQEILFCKPLWTTVSQHVGVPLPFGLAQSLPAQWIMTFWAHVSMGKLIAMAFNIYHCASQERIEPYALTTVAVRVRRRLQRESFAKDGFSYKLEVAS